MNYQKLICLGDSQTFGARTYGCYPLYLGQMLDRSTRYRWSIQNRSKNGDTARQLWFRVGEEVSSWKDTYLACVLIGTNDLANKTPPDLFEEYLRQLVQILEIHGFKGVFIGELPLIRPDGHAFFTRDLIDIHSAYNDRIRRVVENSGVCVRVPMSTLDASGYVDPVHFNELGNQRVAEAFAQALISR